MEHNVLLILAAILVAGIACQWLAWRLRIPAILPLLATGFLAGPVFRILDPRHLLGDLFFPVVSLLVAVILFEGALTLEFRDVRTVAGTVRNLITVGAVITWLVSAVIARWLFGFSWSLSLLFGSLIVVTGPTVIAPLLRNVRPTANIYSILQWEGILIDPLGALLAVLVFESIVAGGHSSNPVIGFLLIVLTGGGIGLAGGWIVAFLMRRHLVPDFLRDLVVLALVVGLFALSNTLQEESGLLAVTVMGIFLANAGLHHVQEVLHFKERLSILFISGLFIILAADIGVDKLRLLDWRAFTMLAIVIFLIRPLAIYVSAIRSNLQRNEKLFLSWIAPRGIVAAAVTALFSFRLESQGVARAELLEPLVFLVIVGTVVLQGGTAKWFARRLGVAEEEPQGFLIVGAHRFARMLASAIQNEGLTVRLVDTNYSNVQQARLAGLDAYYGSVLSEYTDEHISLAGIGRLFALLNNDEANALACRHLQDEFGSAEVYQVVPRTVTELGSFRRPGRNTMGHLLFHESATYRKLLDSVREGAVIKRTRLTEQFTYDDYTGMYRDAFIPLVAVRHKSETDKEVVVARADIEFKPEKGWAVLGLILDDTTDTTHSLGDTTHPRGDSVRAESR